MTFFELGFHGDDYLIKVVSACLDRAANFVETGSFVGSTSVWVAKNYPSLACYTCEPSGKAFAELQKNSDRLGNPQSFNELSVNFVHRLSTLEGNFQERPTVFWLDSHDSNSEGWHWGLRSEVYEFTRNYKQPAIFIDDFAVPGAPHFGYDHYKSNDRLEVCSFEYIKQYITNAAAWRVFYPNYTERTSPHHPLRGWGVLVKYDSLFTELLRNFRFLDEVAAL